MLAAPSYYTSTLISLQHSYLQTNKVEQLKTSSQKVVSDTGKFLSEFKYKVEMIPNEAFDKKYGLSPVYNCC